MPQHPPQPAVTVEITASAIGTLMLDHQITTDASGGPDLLRLALEVRTDDVESDFGAVDCLVETDDDALAVSFVGLDQGNLDALIAYLTAARDQWQAAA
jgi:hypothetical protein